MKIAWFTDTSSDSISLYFSNRILPFFCEEHQVQIFSSERTSFLQKEVDNYLTYNVESFDLSIFLIEDKVSATFVYNVSLINPGIRIFFDNQFNDLKFGNLSHITNGIVYDDLLAAEGYKQAIKIGDYHMRGWSMEPYKSLYPIRYPKTQHSVNIFMNSNYESSDDADSFYLDFPLLLKQTSVSADFEVYKVNSNQKFIPVRVISELEKQTVFIFIAKAKFFNQISIQPGIKQNKVLKEVLSKIKNNSSLLNAMRDELQSYALLNSPGNLYKKLFKICTDNFEMLKSQTELSRNNNLIEQEKLISSVSDMSRLVLDEFSKRFELSE